MVLLLRQKENKKKAKSTPQVASEPQAFCLHQRAPGWYLTARLLGSIGRVCGSDLAFNQSLQIFNRSGVQRPNVSPMYSTRNQFWWVWDQWNTQLDPRFKRPTVGLLVHCSQIWKLRLDPSKHPSRHCVQTAPSSSHRTTILLSRRDLVGLSSFWRSSGSCLGHSLSMLDSGTVVFLQFFEPGCFLGGSKT